MSEKFNLQWNDFQQNVSSAFGELKSDVILLSEDGQQVVDDVDLCQDTTVGQTYQGMITDVGILDQQVQKYAMSVEKRANHQS